MYDIEIYIAKNGRSEVKEYIAKRIYEKTQKTPKKEIDKAKNILEDYKERSNYYE